MLFAEVAVVAVAAVAAELCVAAEVAEVAAAAAHAGDGAACAKLHDLTAGLQSINSLVATLRKLHPADSIADFPKVAFGVIKGPRLAFELGPFIPQQRTYGDGGTMSVWCQRTKALRASLRASRAYGVALVPEASKVR